ncbi:hypothetical protein HPB50_015683 [Hyalomma asiaticum]|uniref:Uncharacterized protein n=1 Tax=Hyalomma asiaticum TaxID=266040 RepID=A0ACB7SYH7_HYAAI|nr:hypothetical protein HPB50_015683 [Hyalomma asiaticum]
MVRHRTGQVAAKGHPDFLEAENMRTVGDRSDSSDGHESLSGVRTAIERACTLCVALEGLPQATGGRASFSQCCTQLSRNGAYLPQRRRTGSAAADGSRGEEDEETRGGRPAGEFQVKDTAPLQAPRGGPILTRGRFEGRRRSPCAAVTKVARSAMP